MSSSSDPRRAGAWLALLLALLAFSPTGAAAPAKPAAPAKDADPGARFVAVSPTVEVAEDFAWTIPLRIVNTSSMGLYLDSLICELEDQGPGETRTDRHSRQDLRMLLSQMEGLSGGDSVVINHLSPAQFEQGKLSYSFYGHRSNKDKIMLQAVVSAEPGVMAGFPSRTALSGGRKVEWVYLPSGTAGRSPGLVIVHGHGSNARLNMRVGHLFVSQGYSVALVSMPGYGLSEGPADFMGPATLAAVGAVMDSFAGLPEVDPARLGVVGQSRGATVAATLAATRKDVRAVLCQSGIYDLWSVYRDTKLPGFREAIVAEAGSDSAAWKARSPITRASAIKIPVYILHGERDQQVPTAQAHAFEGALKAAGATVESQFPNATHAIAVTTMYKTGTGFFGRTLK